jgi:D-alanyl-D-alanine carboxypeptidase
LTTFVTRSIFLAVALCAALMAPAAAAQAAPDKQASFIIDANSGKVLHAQSADEPRFPASLTKMMTLYMLFEAIEAGRMTYDTPIRFSERATGMAPSKLGLKAGEEITALEAIKVLVVKSANDVACAIAETIGGSEYEFAKLMTERARAIGMSSTTFRNASGLPNPAQKSTARDMVTLGLRLQDDFPEHYRLFATTSVTIRGKTYKTHNTLMNGFPGMDGIKTGYTRASGFNLVSSVRADGKHVVGAVFGGKTAATRNALMRSLLFSSLEKASTKRTRQGSPQLVAQTRPAAKRPQFAQADATWAPKTKKSAAEKPAPKPVAVQVAQNVPPPAPAPRPAQTAERRDRIAEVLSEEGDAGADAPQAPRLDLQALRQAMTDTGSVSPAPAPQASPPQDIAGLIRHSIVEDNANAPAQQLGDRQPAARQPGTLGAQANTLAFAAPAQAGAPTQRLSTEPSHLKGPTPAPQSNFAAAPVGLGYEIQIGAYSSASEAQAKLENVRSRAVGLLDRHAGVTLPVLRDNRQIFRARYVHFDESTASHTCLELRRLAIDCFVMKAD